MKSLSSEKKIHWLPVPSMPDRLEELADEIVACAGEAYDRRLATCLKLAEAKRLCKERKILFKTWIAENILPRLDHMKLSVDTAYRYAAIGEKPDPQAALDTRRKNTKAYVAKHEEKKVGLAKPTPTNPVEIEPEAEWEPGVELPSRVLANVLDTIKDSKAVAEAYRKIFKVSSFDLEAKAKIKAEITNLIAKWQRAKSTLDTKGQGNG